MSKFSMAAVGAAIIGILATHVLPALAAAQQEITPDTTPEQLTAKLETGARNYVASEFGEIEAIVIFEVPAVRTDLDKAIGAVVAKALPIAKSPIVQEIEEDAPVVVAVLGAAVGGSGGNQSSASAAPPFTGSIAPPISGSSASAPTAPTPPTA